MFSTVLSLAHLVGLALGVGAATTKLWLLLKAGRDHALLPVYLKVVRPITGLILLGIGLLMFSGIGWLVLGYPLTARLAAKLILVAGILVIGPVIDNVVEPRFRELALAPEGASAPAFARIRRQYLALEIAATGLFYVVIVYWVVANQLPG